MTLRPITGSDARSPEQREARARLVGLQVLRFAAAFAVVLFHIGSGLQLKFGHQSNMLGMGAVGVDIFFVISGFIIAYTTDPKKGAWSFSMRRIVRIVPLYWTLTIGIVAIAMIRPSLLNSTLVNGETLLKSLFFIPFAKTNGAVQPLLFLGWTLNYEMFFYAVYAVCIAMGLRGPVPPAIVIVTLVIVGRFVTVDNIAWRFYTNPLILEFVFGICVYLLHARFPRLFQTRTKVILGIFVASLFVRELTPNLHWIFANGIPAAVLVAATLSWRPRQTPMIVFVVLLGDASYSLYLSHPYIVQALVAALPEGTGLVPQVGVGIAASVISIAVSILLYRIIERPAQTLLNGWLGARKRNLPAAHATP
jgi:peptidoglycan/LPS O-acetylase OafA/YrhL